MRTSEKLQARIESDCGVQVELPERLYGWGEYAWLARRKPGNGAGDIGSPFTMTECVKARSIHLDIDIHGNWWISVGS